MSNNIVPNRAVGRQGLNRSKESTRVELAACAAQFFAQQGYHGTSTQAIAERCQIRKASLFHHYKTKEDIALAALKYVHTECALNIFKHAEDVSANDEQRINNFLNASEQFFTQRIEALLPTLLGLEMREISYFNEAIDAYFQAWNDALIRLLLPLHKKEDIAQQLAAQSLTRIQGHLVVARIQPNQKEFSSLSKELRQLWLAV